MNLCSLLILRKARNSKNWVLSKSYIKLLLVATKPFSKKKLKKSCKQLEKVCRCLKPLHNLPKGINSIKITEADKPVLHRIKEHWQSLINLKKLRIYYLIFLVQWRLNWMKFLRNKKKRKNSKIILRKKTLWANFNKILMKDTEIEQLQEIEKNHLVLNNNNYWLLNNKCRKKFKSKIC